MIPTVLSASMWLIPFYWLFHVSSKMNSYSHGSSNYYKLDYFKNSDLNNNLRAGLRFFAIMVPMMGAVLLAILLTSDKVMAVPLGPEVVLPIILACLSILPGLFDRATKYAIQIVSFLKNRSVPEVINKTYPAKYKPHVHYISSSSDLKEQEQLQKANETTRKIMDELYKVKKTIKDNPEGCFGLSNEQQKTCDTINLGVKFFRNKSYEKYEKLNYRQNNSFLEPDSVSKFNPLIDLITEEQGELLTAIINNAITPIVHRP